MSAVTAEHLFEPFFTTKALGSGTGLGLSIVHSIVTDHDGTIHVDSAPDRGTTFTIFFPTAGDATGQGATIHLDADAVLYADHISVPATVLLVEDQESVRLLLRGHLTGAGYNVLEAPGRQEAIRIATEHAGTIDLLISDVRMPDGSGLEVAQTVAKQRPETGIILISGYVQELMDGLEDLPCAARFLPKPFTRDELLQTAKVLLPAGLNSRTMKASR